jgi:hypothetical protein
MKNSKKKGEGIFYELKTSLLELGIPATGLDMDIDSNSFYSYVNFGNHVTPISVTLSLKKIVIAVEFGDQVIPGEKVEIVHELGNIINDYSSTRSFYVESGCLLAYNEWDFNCILEHKMDLVDNGVDKRMFQEIVSELLLELESYRKLVDEAIKSDKTPDEIWEKFLKDTNPGTLVKP